MHLQLRKCEKLPQTYHKLADLRLRNTSCSFAEFAVAELSLNLRCPGLQIKQGIAQYSANHAIGLLSSNRLQDKTTKKIKLFSTRSLLIK